MRVLILFSMFVSAISSAAVFKHTDTIYRLGVIESRSDADFIIIENFKSAGDCTLSGEGLVVARFHSGETGNRSFSMALAARMAGKEVRLAVDDQLKNSDGQCYVQSIEIFD